MRWRRIARFLDRRFLRLAAASLAVGFALSAVELAFAYGLQAFLAVIGVAKLDQLRILSWVPANSLLAVCVFLSAVAVLRGSLHWAQEYLRNAALQTFRYVQSARVVRWALSGNSVNSGYVSFLLKDQVGYACEVVMCLQQTLLQGAMNLFLLLAMFWISWQLTLCACVFAVAMLIPLRLLNGRIKTLGAEIAASSQMLMGSLLMAVRNLLLLRIYGIEGREARIAEERLAVFLRTSVTYASLGGMMLAVPQVVGTVLICLLTGYAMREVILPGGVLLTFFYLFFRFAQNGSLLMNSITRLIYHWEQLRLLYAWWLSAPESGTESVPPRQRPAAGNGGGPVRRLRDPIGWNLGQVAFAYPGVPELVLDRVDLSVPPGSAVVITGPSGVGKSTLVNLMLGQLEPTRGTVLARLDGAERPLSAARETLLQNVGYVGPESFIIDGTMRENLAFGLFDVPSDAEMRDALRAADCGFVDELPSGLEHRITEQGLGLSAGQKQRLSLARALLRKPKALILDEATSNLDVQSEARLVETLKALAGKVTIVAVTHRPGVLALSTAKLTLTRPDAPEICV